MRSSSEDRFRSLRERAEHLLDSDAPERHAQFEEDVASLLEELRVHQIELEIQNDELRSAQRTLEASRERYRELFDRAPIGYLVFDRDGVVQDVNLTASDQIGIARDRLRRKPFLLYLVPEYRDLFSHHLRLTLAHDAEQTTELIVQRRDGTTFWARLQSVPFPAVDGEPRIRTALLNISEQKQLEQELIAAREEALQTTQVQRAFLSSMSHEIRTPLTSVIGFADVLDELAADKQQKEIARLIKGSGRRLLSTLHSVLSYARLQEDEDEVQLRALDVVSLTHESVRLLQPLAESKGVDLLFACSEPSSHARLNAEHLDRVLDNLVGNALKYTDEGEVWVRVHADDQTVEIAVSDTGVGIDPAMQEMIFEPFFQGGAGLARTRDGIGLGLSITKQLVDLMDGTIRVDSEWQEGSTFTVAFPRVPEPADDPDDASPAMHFTPTPQWNILLIDDQPETHQLVRLFLRDAAEVDCVRYTDDAIDALSDRRYDAVLVDIQLEEKQTGIELLHRLRGSSRTAQVPMVAFTAYALPGDEERFLKSGFDAYLGKPFTKQDLALTIRSVVNRTQRKRGDGPNPR